MRTKWRVLGILAALMAAPVTLAPAAYASCPPDYGYSWSGTTASHIDMVPKVIGDAGITLSITLTSGSTATATIGGSLQTTQSVFFASAQEEINASISQSVTAQVSYGGSWKVPTTASWGELHAGASSYTSTWKYGHYTPACAWTVTSQGTAKLPYSAPAFWHVVHN